MAKQPKSTKAKRPKVAASVSRSSGRAHGGRSIVHLVPKLRVTIRQERAVTLRLSGLSYAQIGNELDIEAQTASALVRTAYENHTKQLTESLEQVREMELGKLDRIEAVLWDLLQEGGGELVTVETGMTVHGPMDKVVRRHPGVGGVVDRLLAVQQSRRAILGLDAATKYEHTGKGGGPIALEAISRIVQRGEALRALAAANKPKGKE